jgi:hypothetical protein
MKAHRRNGIPTLMLQEGGEATSSAFGRFFTPSQKEYENRERQQFIAALTRSTPSIFTQQTPAQQKLRVPTRDLSRDLRIRTQGGLNSLTGSDYASTISEYYDRSLAPNIDPGIRGVLKKEYDRVVLPRMRVRQGSIAAAQAAGSPLEDDIVRLAKISEADRQEQEGLAGTATAPAETATAPAETATTPAGTAATPAGTAATPAATVAPESPDAEALRQATGAPTQAEEAAATADKNGAPTPTTNPTVVTSIQSTISDIMGGEEAQFDEGKRLQELKEKFGLGISDMEKAAPGLAFAFSLMGAQRAPGESPFNALVRAAASAGEAATKSNLALKQRERAIDSSLASTVLGEKKAAEQYARSMEWVAVWNGGFDERGMPKAEYLRMNADQIQKANEAGLQIVPVNVVSSATTAFATRSRAAAEATIELGKRVGKALEPTAVGMKFLTNQNQDVNGRRLTGFDPKDGKLREVVIADDVSGQGRFVGNLLKDSAATIGLVDEMDGLIDQSTGAVNVASAAFDKARSLLNLSKGDTAEDFYRKASEKGGVAFNNLSGFAKSKINVDNAYNELGADGVKRLLNIQGDFSEEDLKKRLSENINNVRGHKVIEKPAENASPDVKSAYEARVRFRAIQNALAAQLAPILLGESGRTISDADRVRVIALLGGFSDFSKAGVLTTAEEMRQSTRMLREILGKYKDSALQDAVRMINSYDEASSYISPITKGALYAPSRDDEEVIRELKGYAQQFNKPNAGQAGQTSGVTTYSASELSQGSS